MHNPQCLVLSLDFDGCTDRPSSQTAIIQHVFEVYTQYPSINKVIFLIGSLRQSLRLDISNALRNSDFPHYLSCTSLLDEMVPRLKARLDAHHPEHRIEIIFDTFLQADIYGELDAGTSFNAMKHVFSTTPPDILRDCEDVELRVMVRNKAGVEINLMNAPHLTDCGKITMIYGQIHHIATNYTDSSILMHFYDDRPDILHGLLRFYQSNTQYIPSNMTLKLFCQTSLPGHVPLSIGTYLSGHGKANTELHHNLLELAHMLSWNSISEYFPDLKHYLEEAIKPTHQTPPTAENFKETEYSRITIPHEFTDEQEAIMSYQSILLEARELLEDSIQLEIEFFNEYLKKLEHFNEHFELYEATYKRQGLFNQESLCREDFMVLNELECKLQEYSGYSFEYERMEAEDYADKRCILDQSIAEYEKQFEAFKEYLVVRISSSLGIPGEELLRKVEIFNNSIFSTAPTESSELEYLSTTAASELKEAQPR